MCPPFLSFSLCSLPHTSAKAIETQGRAPVSVTLDGFAVASEPLGFQVETA